MWESLVYKNPKVLIGSQTIVEDLSFPTQNFELQTLVPTHERYSIVHWTPRRLCQHLWVKLAKND